MNGGSDGAKSTGSPTGKARCRSSQYRTHSGTLLSLQALTGILSSPSKPSQPSRAYLHVTRRDELAPLSQKVQSSRWEDAKETYNDPALVSPPTVEFAIYKKIPGEKKRVDGRQGTIDQDPEFMAFLEALANPDAQKEAAEAELSLEEAIKAEKTTTTPLVEYLKERKAAKAKEAAAAKSAKHARQDSQGGKGKAAATPVEEPKKKSRDGRGEKGHERSSERPRESVKILTKKAAAAAEAAAEAARAVAAQMKPAAAARPSSQSGTQEQPKSRRAGIAAAARILQRDLGLSPGNAHRKARQEAAKAESDSKVTAPKEIAKPVPTAAPESAPPSIPTGPSASAAAAKLQPPAAGRSRNRKRGAGDDIGKTKGEATGEKAAESSNPAPAKAPITLMKKKESQPPGPSLQSPPAAPAAPTGPSKGGPSLSQALTPAPPTGPKAAAQKQSGPSKKGTGAATPSPGATRAFIKHANHSQGVTEPLLKEALQVFGAVTSVEMDRKKGFAYAEFADYSGLAKAMAASPVAVAQATVQVVERKDMGKKASGPTQPKSAAAASTSTPAPLTAPAKVQAPAAAEQSSAPPTPVSTGPMAEKAGGEQGSKRGGRRRGGRGRGDKDAKDPPKDGSAKKQDGAGSSPAPTANVTG